MEDETAPHFLVQSHAWLGQRLAVLLAKTHLFLIGLTQESEHLSHTPSAVVVALFCERFPQQPNLRHRLIDVRSLADDEAIFTYRLVRLLRSRDRVKLSQQLSTAKI